MFKISIILGLCMTALAIGCILPETPLEYEETDSLPPAAHEPPGIDEMIYISDVIVVASFVSARAATQTVSGGLLRQSTYYPVQVLTFRASEYLKGTGPTNFTVEVVDDRPTGGVEGVFYDGHLTQAAALADAQAAIDGRNTTWDDRPGVLFLKGPLTAVASSQSGTRNTDGATPSRNYGFMHSNLYVQSTFDYTVDTLSRTWLPAKEAPATSRSETTKSTTNSNPEYITDGSETPPPVTTLSALKSRIAAIKADEVAGAGIDGYDDCLSHKYGRERYSRNWAPPTLEREIPSGAAAEAPLYESKKIFGDDYTIFTVSGADAVHFDTVITDDDEDPSNGYYYKDITSRPLPAGKYTANFHQQHYSDVVCNHNPTQNNYHVFNVTVTAPAGTLHEAFFDPVTVGTAVKADGSNGVLKPTSFTVGGTSTEIASLEWASNQVVLTLGTHVSLSGQVLDFIGLDGNVALSLFADEATANSTAGTYTWTMSSQPWEDGDKLMLRIRPVGTEIFLTNLPSSMVQGVTHWFMVNLTNLNRSRSYSYRLSADNANVAFHNSACHSAPVNVTVSAGETSYARQHALLGCGTPGSTVTATLLEGTTEVDTTTYSVTVMPPPPPSVAIESLASSMEEGENDQFVINASHLDTAHGHTIRLTTDNANMGFDAECTDREEDLTVGRGSAAYVDSRRLYGCTAPGGTLTVTLLQGETVVATTTYDVEVTPPPPPSVEFLNSPYTLESGGSVVVRMRVSNLDADSSYTILRVAGQRQLGLQPGLHQSGIFRRDIRQELI